MPVYKICPVCKNKFKVPGKKTKRIYCSYKCYWNHLKGAVRDKRHPHKKCPVCEQLFYSSDNTRQFCSRKCYLIYHGKKEKTCLVCKMKFTPKNTENVTCSIECSYKLRSGGNNPKWVGGIDFHKTFRGVGWNVIKEKILDRDNHTCLICGEPGDIVHHIIPWDEGGNNRDENLATVCRKCHGYVHGVRDNRFKGNRRGVKITAIDRIEKETTVYDIGVETDHSFIVSGIVVHNCLICAQFDNKIWRRLSNAPDSPKAVSKINDDLIIDGEAPRPEKDTHSRCRCILVPVLEGMAEEMSKGIHYQDWFERQPNDRKLDILGPTRYKEYLEGREVTQFARDGKITTLKEMGLDRIERKQIRTAVTNIGNINPDTVELAGDFKAGSEALKRRLAEMQNSAVNLLKEKSGERDITITASSGIVTDFTSRTPENIIVPRELMDKMKSYEKRSLTSIHTHSSGGFSDTDIYAAYSNPNIGKMIAMCATGEIYEIDVSSGKMPALEEFKKIYAKTYKRICKMFNIDSRIGSIYAINMTNRKIAEKYGWGYSEGWQK